MRNKAEIMDRLRVLHAEAEANHYKTGPGDILFSYWAGMADGYKRALTEVDWLPDPTPPATAATSSTPSLQRSQVTKGRAAAALTAGLQRSPRQQVPPA